MKLLIFRTDIRTQQKINALKPLFNSHPVITDWNVDTQDIDNVLRIETSGNLEETDVINLVKPYGFHCEVLPD